MKSLLLKNIPEELVPFILKTQWELKAKKKSCQLQIGQAVIHIIKEYKKLTDK